MAETTEYSQRHPCQICGREHVGTACDAPTPKQREEREELICEMCGRHHPVWSASNDLWNPVMRLPDGSDHIPFVCPTCFMVRAAEMGVETSFRVLRASNLRTHSPEEPSPETRIADARTMLWDEAYARSPDDPDRAFDIIINEEIRRADTPPLSPEEPDEVVCSTCGERRPRDPVGMRGRSEEGEERYSVGEILDALFYAEEEYSPRRPASLASLVMSRLRHPIGQPLDTEEDSDGA